jgi:hypothetical protein
MQAVVENIRWHHVPLAYDSIASIACRTLAARFRGGTFEIVSRGIVRAGAELMVGTAMPRQLEYPINFEMSEIPSDLQFKLATR